MKGETGNGISGISLTNTEGLVDTYTITYTDGTTTTFTVTNGKDGVQGIQGIQGEKGEDGHTPVITIQNGYWYVDGENTNVLAEGLKGETGPQGLSAYEIFIKYYPEYAGTEQEWIYAVATNDVCSLFGHEEVIDEAVSASCTTDGLTEGKHCIICGEVIVPQTVVAALNHAYSDEWNHDDDYHWRDVICGCDVNVYDKGEHIWDNGVAEDDIITYTCTICKITKKELAQGKVYSDGLEYEFNEFEQSYSIIGIGTCTDTDVIIPPIYNGLLVTSIGNSAFFGCKGLTSIEIPSNVTSIDSYAFENCSSLVSITFKEGSQLESIGDSAFDYCISLTSIEIPSSVIFIGPQAFSDCWSLTSIVIPENVTSIRDKAFSYCNSLTRIIIPNSVTSIGDSAFNCCISLKSIVIPNSVTTIKYKAFSSCDSLIIYCEAQSKPDDWDSEWNYDDRPVYWGATKEDIIEENGIQYLIIDGEAILMGYVGSATEVVIPSNIGVNGTQYDVTSIRDNAFSYCNSLTRIIIPNSVTSIGDSAFNSCDSLTNIVIPNSVTSIGDSAFDSCDSLTNIVIPNSVTSIGSYAFSNCWSLVIYCEVESQPDGWSSSWNYFNRSVYWGVTKEDIIEENGIQYLIIDGEAILTKYVGSATEVVIPSNIGVNNSQFNVTSIGDSAFDYCISLTNITIPSSVTSIDESAFSDCINLTSIVIPNSVTIIGDSAFINHHSLSIYCEAKSQPSGWNSNWNYSNRPVYWAGEWEYDADRNPVPLS